jgi:hypothetical protein
MTFNTQGTADTLNLDDVLAGLAQLPLEGVWLRPDAREDPLDDAIFDAVNRSGVSLSLVMSEIAEQATPGEFETIRSAFADEQAIADSLDAHLVAAADAGIMLSLEDFVELHATPKQLERVSAALQRRLASEMVALLELAEKQRIAKRTGGFVPHQEVTRAMAPALARERRRQEMRRQARG